jgi:hypothetical protein
LVLPLCGRRSIQQVVWIEQDNILGPENDHVTSRPGDRI